MNGMGNGLAGTPAAAPVDPSSIARECIRHTHQNLIGVFVSVPIGAALLLYMLADKIGSTRILAWFALILFWTGLRFWFYMAFRRRARETFDPAAWGGMQSFLTITAGVIWGAMPLVAYPPDSLSGQMFIALMVGGMAAGGTYAYAAMPRTAQAFLAASLFPIVAVNLAMGTVDHLPIGVMLAVYYLMLAVITRNNARTVRSAISLALENKALAEGMGKARDEAESAARKLGVEIAGRMKASQAIKESEERFRQLSEAGFEGVVINIDGKVVDCNSAFARMFGYEPKDVIGTVPVNLSPPESEAIIMAHIRRGSEDVYEAMGRKKDGTLFPIEIQGRAILHHGMNARVTAVRDITARKRADEDLRNSEMRFRLLVESSPFCIHEIGMDGNVLSMNKAGLVMLGLQGEGEVLGTPYLDAVGGKDKARVAALMREAFSGTASHFEFDSRGDEPQRFKSCFVPIRGGDGAVIKLMGVTEDITERKAAEKRLKAAKEEAEEATRLKDKFVSLVSHDLKDPLSSVRGFLSLLHLEHGDIEKKDAEAMIASALDASNNMLNVIENLLDISRIKTGQLQPNARLTDLHSVAVKAGLAYANYASVKKIEIWNEVPPGVTGYADEHLLLQVLKNLLSNAIKFCREGGTVRIYLPGPGMVAVKDTGGGIPPSLLPDIFKYEVKTSTPGTAGETGTGFGLPLSHDIMKAHGGDLRVESEAGKGSTFYIILPRLPEGAAPAD